MIARRILVCGSRDWDDTDIIWQVLYGFQNFAAGNWDGDDDDFDGDYLTIIEGDAKGADRMAGDWALVEKHQGTGLEVYPADWEQYGRAAGPIRNKQMLEEGKPDLVLAFSDDLSTSKGTANMVKQAKKAGLPVYVIGRP